jgi:hypothetical protein
MTIEAGFFGNGPRLCIPIGLLRHGRILVIVPVGNQLNESEQSQTDKNDQA